MFHVTPDLEGEGLQCRVAVTGRGEGGDQSEVYSGQYRRASSIRHVVGSHVVLTMLALACIQAETARAWSNDQPSALAHNYS